MHQTSIEKSRPAIKITPSNEKTGSVRIALEISFPNEAGEEQDRAFLLIGKIMREALPDPEQRQQFLADLESARREAFAG